MQRIVEEYKKIQYRGYKLRTKQCLSLTRLTNKIFLRTNTKCVRPSEIFRTWYPLFYFLVFRETPSAVQNTQSAYCSSSVESSSKGTDRSVSEFDGVSDGVRSRQTLLFRLFEGPRRAFDASVLVLDIVVCLIFFF